MFSSFISYHFTLLFLDRPFSIQATQTSKVNKGLGFYCESSRIYLSWFKRGIKVKQVCRSLELLQITNKQRLNGMKKEKERECKRKERKCSNLDTFPIQCLYWLQSVQDIEEPPQLWSCKHPQSRGPKETLHNLGTIESRASWTLGGLRPTFTHGHGSRKPVFLLAGSSPNSIGLKTTFIRIKPNVSIAHNRTEATFSSFQT